MQRRPGESTGPLRLDRHKFITRQILFAFSIVCRMRVIDVPGHVTDIFIEMWNATQAAGARRT